MKAKGLNEWSKIRERGKRSFILKYGIALFGLPLGIVIVFMSNILHNGIAKTFVPITILGCIISGILYGVIIGLIYGILAWKSNEKEWGKCKLGEN